MNKTVFTLERYKERTFEEIVKTYKLFYDNDLNSFVIRFFDGEEMFITRNKFLLTIKEEEFNKELDEYIG
jgi:hypothetical protein